jgi:hypothetical protein
MRRPVAIAPGRRHDGVAARRDDACAAISKSYGKLGGAQSVDGEESREDAMSKGQLHQDDRRRAARMVYRPDHFLAVMVFAALAILVMSAAFIALSLG